MVAAGLSPEQALAQINRLIDQQAFTRAADDIFLASALIFVLLISSVWMVRRTGQTAAAVDTGGAH
jgi:DHA2 family multidrug resistance protein